jgi:hypothetical protein
MTAGRNRLVGRWREPSPSVPLVVAAALLLVLALAARVGYVLRSSG